MNLRRNGSVVRRALAQAVTLTTLSWGSGAGAQGSQSTDSTLQACAQAYSAGQEERLRGDRKAAIEQFESCSSPSCPAIVVEDCRRWLGEVNAEFSTARVSVRSSDGQRLAAVSVFVDGTEVELGADGALELAPGEHEFRLEAPDHEPARVRRKLSGGERDAALNVVLLPRVRRGGDAEAPQHSSAQAAGAAADSGAGGKKVPAASIVLGSVSVVSFGIAVGFGLSAGSEYRSLENDCAPDCKLSQTDGVSEKALIADVALVTGVLALGSALWIYFAQDDADSVAVGVAPSGNGAQGSLRARF